MFFYISPLWVSEVRTVALNHLRWFFGALIFTLASK